MPTLWVYALVSLVKLHFFRGCLWGVWGSSHTPDIEFEHLPILTNAFFFVLRTADFVEIVNVHSCEDDVAGPGEWRSGSVVFTTKLGVAGPRTRHSRNRPIVGHRSRRRNSRSRSRRRGRGRSQRDEQDEHSRGGDHGLLSFDKVLVIAEHECQKRSAGWPVELDRPLHIFANSQNLIRRECRVGGRTPTFYIFRKPPWNRSPGAMMPSRHDTCPSGILH